MKYPKIQSIFKRDEKGKFIPGEYSKPEFEYLKDNTWIWTEKVDGMNIRAVWIGNKFKFYGRTDKAIIPSKLLEELNRLFNREEVTEWMLDNFGMNIVTFFGEGYGNNIQKVGKLYSPNNKFILFDIAIDYLDNVLWLKRKDVKDIANKLNLDIVPVVGEGTLDEAIEFVKSHPKSTLSDKVFMEGLVLRPKVDILDRLGKRIITKVKYKDFQV